MPRLAPVTRIVLPSMVICTAFPAAPPVAAPYLCRPGGRPGIAAERLPAEESDELVTGVGRVARPNRVGEEPRPGLRWYEQRDRRQQNGGQARGHRPIGATCNRDVPAMDGDLHGPGKYDDARRELAVPDGERPGGWHGARCGSKQRGQLLAQPPDGIGS